MFSNTREGEENSGGKRAGLVSTSQVITGVLGEG